MSTNKIKVDENKNAVIGYVGRVTLKKYDNKRKKVISTSKIKNNGTKYLFKFLCNALVKQYDQTQAPQYLDVSNNVVSWDKDSGIQTESLKTALSYRSKLSNTDVVEETNNYKVRFQAVISYGQLLNATSPIKSLLLYASREIKDTQSALAYININTDSDNELVLQQGQSFLIEWEMQFGNVILDEGV